MLAFCYERFDSDSVRVFLHQFGLYAVEPGRRSNVLLIFLTRETLLVGDMAHFMVLGFILLHLFDVFPNSVVTLAML